MLLHKSHDKVYWEQNLNINKFPPLQFNHLKACDSLAILGKTLFSVHHISFGGENISQHVLWDFWAPHF